MDFSILRHHFDKLSELEALQKVLLGFDLLENLLHGRLRRVCVDLSFLLAFDLRDLLLFLFAV